jgi:hypothetical protein
VRKNKSLSEPLKEVSLKYGQVKLLLTSFYIELWSKHTVLTDIKMLFINSMMHGPPKRMLNVR